MALERHKILQQAQVFAARGQHEAAIAEWKKLAAETPNDGSIHNSIGDLHLKRNATTEAAAAFLQAGAAFRAEGATLKAIAAFKKVLKSDPTRYEVYRYLGDLNAERGLVSSAVQDYLTLGKYYLKERRGKEALEIYKMIISHDPSNLNAQQRVAELCIQENQQDEATKVYLQLGRERSAQGQYEEANDAYLAVLRIDPKNSEAAQFVESMKKGATGSIKAVKPGPAASAPQKLSEPVDLLSEVTRRIEEKQYAGAEAILNQMLTKEPGNPQVCRLLARLHLQRGDVNVALGEYRFLAGAALRAHDVVLAESLLVEFLSEKPDTVPLLELYGQLYEEKGDGAAAAKQYARAAELLLRHPEPGLETLHEELFEKVRALSTDVELVNGLAAKIRGEAVADAYRTSVFGGEPKTIEPEMSAKTSLQHDDGEFSVAEAQQDETGTAISNSSPDQDRHFSLEGAEPDGINGFVKTTASEKSNFSLANAQPDVNELWTETAQPQEPDGHQTTRLADVEEAADCAASSENPQDTEAYGSSTFREDVEQSNPAIVQVATEPAQDYEAHFTLGVAYKNMGLYSDAREEFEVSKTVEAFYVDSCLMAALCAKEEHLLPQAIQGLETVLSDPRCRGAKAQAIRYELGLLYEAEAQWGKAAETFHSIPSFHDVPQRLEALQEKSADGTGGGFPP